MLKEDFHFSLFDFALSVSSIIDAISPTLVNHQKRVAYIAWNIGKELGLGIEQRRKLFLASLLHDIGGLSLKERLDVLNFDEDSSYNKHAELGYLILKDFKELTDEAYIIRYHHVPWDYGAGREKNGESIPIESHILHLADRISALIDYNHEVLGQVGGIVERIKGLSGKVFSPELVNEFVKISNREYLWLDVVSPNLDDELNKIHNLPLAFFDIESIRNFAKVLMHIVDFRSRFTAIHSSSVSTCAVELAKLAGFSEKECTTMEIAGYLHDLGKLAVPKEILEKPDKLSTEEFNVVKSHTYYTYRILSCIPNFETINRWASFHHERLDGSGYPFRLSAFDLPLGSRIMGVADVFTALTEDRPYRAGMDVDKALKIIENMSQNNILDVYTVQLLKKNIAKVNEARIYSQTEALREYEKFSQSGVLY
ncbi:HD-GYP domain-containing protein [Caldisericum sp. AR60]|uniref:HD-GYP domain-containing protein n=1 Tax=Caldisericum sp. AR60 TaxID=3397852 RepID=UPI0039FC30D3